MDPHVRHARYSPGKAQEILPGAAVLVCYEEAVIGCAALDQEGVGWGVTWMPILPRQLQPQTEVASRDLQAFQNLPGRGSFVSYITPAPQIISLSGFGSQLISLP